jgi:2-phospho-L-lactate/phosphoenolpyruvate guanylyltransferase
MTLHVLIPCKSFNTGKSRLSTVIDSDMRRTLCIKFFERALDTALSLVPAVHCHVVTNDTDAAAYSSVRGVNVLVDPGQGLNHALSVSRDAVASIKTDRISLLVFPIDLPLVDASILAEFCTILADVVIAPDREYNGTNGLCIGPAAVRNFVFRFGSGSFAAHQKETYGGSWRVSTFENSRLGFDVDLPDDYLEWQRLSLPKNQHASFGCAQAYEQ